MCTECGHRLNVPVYCGDRFCPVCSKPRLSRVRRRLKFIIRNVKLEPGYTLKHLTLTIPNEIDLEKMLNRLTKSFRRLRSRAFWKNKVRGGAFVFEVTGIPGNWHGHLHILIESLYLPWETLRDLWIAISGGRGVYIKKIPMQQAIHYLTSYISKSPETSEHSSEISLYLKGRRLFQPFGTWHALVKGYNQAPCICQKCKGEQTFALCALIDGGMFQVWDIVYDP